MSVVKTNHHNIINDDMWCHHVYSIEGKGLVINPIYMDEVLIIKSPFKFSKEDIERLVWIDFFQDCEICYEQTSIEELIDEGCLDDVVSRYSANLASASLLSGLTSIMVEEMLQ